MFASGKTSAASTGGYQISRSLRFNSADSAYLNRTPASAGNRKTWTWSAWVKRGSLGSAQTLFSASDSSGTNEALISFPATDVFRFYSYIGSLQMQLDTTQVFRDPSAWYHLVVAVDTTQATASNRAKLYVNGSQITALDTATYSAQNYDTYINTTQPHAIGRDPFTGRYFSGYMTEINFIDGQALTPSSFGETNAQTGVWSPKAYSGSYGTNGFYLNFSDNSNTTAATLGKDYSGNGNNWTPNNFSVTAGSGNDSLVDSPTSFGTDTGVGGTVRGNYCTLNPLYKNGAGTPAITNGNLDMLAGGTGDSYFGGTFSISSGKWYYECLVNSVASSGGTGLLIGICKTSAPNGVNVGAYRNTSEIYNLDGTTQTAGATYATGDLLGVAFDIDAGTVQFYKNGTAQGATPSFTFTAGTEVFVRGRSDGANPSVTFNFGQRPFAYTAPSGFKALCTQNLPTPTIGATTATQANLYYDASLYTGNGSNQTITNSGFQPDWVWIKARSNSQGSSLVDAVRGASKVLISNSTAAEATLTSPPTFNSNGFTSTTDISTNGYTYVAWQWIANGSGSTNTAGSITSTVSANTTSGFSVVTYTGTGANATVGHGIGVAPSMIIIKNRSTSSYDWMVYHTSIGNTQYLRLNQTDAAATSSSAFNNTSPTSTVFSLGNGSLGNQSTYTYVAYCFAEVAGYSKFGSYTGNGSADGPFVYTGFRPAYIMLKNTANPYTDWYVLDVARNTYNAAGLILRPDTSGAEQNYAPLLDFLSNGFKIRDTSAPWNESGSSIIYACFAQNPFKYSLAR
jgi:hypothetical protein